MCNRLYVVYCKEKRKIENYHSSLLSTQYRCVMLLIFTDLVSTSYSYIDQVRRKVHEDLKPENLPFPTQRPFIEISFFLIIIIGFPLQSIYVYQFPLCILIDFFIRNQIILQFICHQTLNEEPINLWLNNNQTVGCTTVQQCDPFIQIFSN